MSNFNSNSIHVYPLSTTRASGVTNGARDTYLSEYAITNLVKAIVDKDRYVYYADNWSSPERLMFVIDGYMFDLTLPENSKPLFVKLDMKSSTGTFPELKSDDSNGEYFKGLQYETSDPRNSEYFQLLDDDGKVPESSKIKFEIGKSIDFFQDYTIIVDGNGFTSDNSISTPDDIIPTPDNSIFTYESRNDETIITGLKENINTESLYIPSNIIFPVTSIGARAFYGCSRLTSITIPNSITSIGDAAFYGCSSLKDVYITDLTAWCNIDFGNGISNPLYYADNLYINGVLTTNLVIPSGVTSIGDAAFYGCSSLTTITIPEGVTSIGSQAFRGCSSLTSIIVDEGNATYRSENNCLIEKSTNKLVLGCKNSTIPSGVTSIGDFTFDGCFSLQNITIPDSVTSIGKFAFSHCDNLNSIPIPEGVTRIDFGAFSYCSNLTSIIYTGTISQWQSIAFGTMWNEGTGSYIIHCTDGDIAKDGTITPK